MKTTKTYNATLNKSATIYQDREPSEGKWVMEGASNYLTNDNFKDLSSDSIIKIDIDINNIVDANGVVKMEGSDMSTKFDAVFDQIANLKTSLSKDAKLVDVKIINVDGVKTELEVLAVFGTNNGSGGSPQAWPTNGLNIQQSAWVLSTELNIQLSLGMFSTPIGGWYSNVNILYNGGIGYYIDVPNQVSYGCTNCLWDNLDNAHPTDGSTNCFPPSAYQTYFDRGLTLMNNVKNSLPPSNSYVTGLIGCNYEGAILVPSSGSLSCSGWGNHYIDEIYVGTGNAY